jgi:hypothetical protein
MDNFVSFSAWWTPRTQMLGCPQNRVNSSIFRVSAKVVWGGPQMVGIILLVEALIPIGDMLVILAAKGSARSAFGMHGLTALLMILAAVPLTMGAT